uniref:Dynein light chain n=1 Tax=Ascaris lumbricoides TaxID=6252 RepID=A0A0M3IUP8_ASCLU
MTSDAKIEQAMVALRDEDHYDGSCIKESETDVNVKHREGNIGTLDGG